MTMIMGCVKNAELQSKDYPFIITRDVTGIDSTGATFSADIVDYGKKEITDFGFICSYPGTSFTYSLSGTGDLKHFILRVTSDLEAGKTYTCTAYAKTDETTVLGNNVPFKSEGSPSPQVIDFTPKEGFDKTVVRLQGKNFSNLSSGNKVYVNNVLARIISSTGEMIEFETPAMSFCGEVSVKVMTGSKYGIAASKFRVIGPEIESVSSLTGHSGDSVTISGKYFTQNGSPVQVLFNNYKATILSTTSTKIRAIVPVTGEYFVDARYMIKVVTGLKSVTFKDTYYFVRLWENKQPTPFDWSWRYQSFTYNGDGYILELNTKLLYRYSPASDTWSPVAGSEFPGDRYEDGLHIVIGDALFKAGGLDYLSEKLKALWSYDFINNSWVKKNDLPFTFSRGTFFKLNNQCYVITASGEFWKCDFVNEQYTRMNDFPYAFTYSLGSAFVIDNKAFMVTNGRTWQYDDVNDSWTGKATNIFMSEQYCENPFGFAMNNTGYVLQAGQHLYKYDYLNDRWVLTSNYPGERGDNSIKTVFVIGNVAYVAATASNYAGCAPLMFSYQEMP